MDMGPGSSCLECGHDLGEQFWSWSHKLECHVPSTRCLPSPEWQQMGDYFFYMPIVLFSFFLFFFFMFTMVCIHTCILNENERLLWTGCATQTTVKFAWSVSLTNYVHSPFVGVMFSSWTVKNLTFLDSMPPRHLFLQDRKPSISLYSNLFRPVWTLFTSEGLFWKGFFFFFLALFLSLRCNVISAFK